MMHMSKVIIGALIGMAAMGLVFGALIGVAYVVVTFGWPAIVAMLIALGGLSGAYVAYNTKIPNECVCDMGCKACTGVDI
jgi:hypothetical protein